VNALEGDRADDVRDYLLDGGFGVNVGFPDLNLRTLLHLACDYGALKVAEYVLADPATNPLQTDALGRNAVWHCSNLGQVEILKSLVAFGHDTGLSVVANDDQGHPLTPVGVARRHTQRTSGPERAKYLEIAFLWLQLEEEPHDPQFLSTLRREVLSRSRFGPTIPNIPYSSAAHRNPHAATKRQDV